MLVIRSIFTRISYSEVNKKNLIIHKYSFTGYDKSKLHI